MFLGADNNIFERAAALRENPTDAEAILWSFLRHKPLGFKFRRQHPISIYVADFYCHALKLIIEVDGGIHDVEAVRNHDVERQKNLEAEGICFLRFMNDDVLKNLEGVKVAIIDNLKYMNRKKTYISR